MNFNRKIHTPIGYELVLRTYFLHALANTDAAAAAQPPDVGPAPIKVHLAIGIIRPLIFRGLP